MNATRMIALATSSPILTLNDAKGSNGRGSRSHAAPSPPRDLERVPNAVNGADEFRTELAAQRLHVGVDGTALHAGAPAPYVFEQSVAGNRRAGPACQED